MGDDVRILAGLVLLSALSWVVSPSLRSWRHSHPPDFPLLQPATSRHSQVWLTKTTESSSKNHVLQSRPEGKHVAGWVGLLLGDPLDLNAATPVDLEALPGVGPVTASAIIRARQDRKRFRSPSDLLYARGIGEKTLDRLKPWVEVSAPVP